MGNNTTPSQAELAAQQVFDRVKKELPTAWLGGFQKMILTKALTEALAEAERRVWLEWSSEKPKVSGWYWWREGKYIDIAQVVECDIDPAKRLYISGQIISGWVDDKDGEWAGPIPEPRQAQPPAQEGDGQ